MFILIINKIKLTIKGKSFKVASWPPTILLSITVPAEIILVTITNFFKKYSIWLMLTTTICNAFYNIVFSLLQLPTLRRHSVKNLKWEGLSINSSVQRFLPSLINHVKGLFTLLVFEIFSFKESKVKNHLFLFFSFWSEKL